MIGTHTTDASELIDDLVETNIAKIWADIDLLGKETDSEKWVAKFKNIAQKYLMSSRFALMRLLYNRAVPHTQNNQNQAHNQYSILVDQDLIIFCDISMEHALNLSPEEHMAYIKYLLEIAGPSPEENPDLHEQIISRAWYDEEAANAVMKYYLPESITKDPNQFKKHVSRIEKENRKQYSTSFSRKEALQLGHILRFSLEEMQWYLMRVFDVDDGLRMNHSSDLIEAYCFLTEASCFQAEALKKQYHDKTHGIEKRDDCERSHNWTQQITSGLLDHIETWKTHPETMDDNFLCWLIDHASGLDIPSRTARRVYRNLASYAYAGALPQEERLLDELLHISDMDEDSEEALDHLYCDGHISESNCNKIAEHLYWENKILTDPDVKDNTKPWSVITTRKDKELSVSYGSVNSSRTRIQSLLMGTEEVEKGDLLYLLWFTFNLAWSDTEVTDQNVIYNRIFDLKDAAAAFLDSALLPPFYPPHLMEQSMLLSIIYAGKTGTDPSVIYGSVLQSLRDTRTSGKKSGKHTLEEQIDIITHYRNAEPRITLKQCALLYGISEQTISRWQKELIEKGHIKE